MNAKNFISTLITTISSPVTSRRPLRPTRHGRKVIPETKSLIPTSAPSTQAWVTTKNPWPKHKRHFDLNPSGLNYSNLAGYIYLSEPSGRSAASPPKKRKRRNSIRRICGRSCTNWRFLKNDSAAMAQNLAWASGKPGIEDTLLAMHAGFHRLCRAASQGRRAYATSSRFGNPRRREGNGRGLRSRRPVYARRCLATLIWPNNMPLPRWP